VLPTTIIGENEGAGDAMSPLHNDEVKHAAAIIVAAFLNPRMLDYYNIGIGNYFDRLAFLDTVGWDYERFSEATQACRSAKFVPDTRVGFMNQPKTVIDEHGKIFLWYLPGLLLPHRVVRSTVPVQNPMFANIAVRRS
jgi:hypothetical protein